MVIGKTLLSGMCEACRLNVVADKSAMNYSWDMYSTPSKQIPGIRSLRLSRGWTQDELAIAAGVSARTIQRAEEGARRVSLDTQKAIAAALDVDLKALEQEPSQLYVLSPAVFRQLRRSVSEWAVTAPEGAEPPLSVGDIRQQLFEEDAFESLCLRLRRHGWHLVGRDFREGKLHGALIMVVPQDGVWTASVRMRG